MACSVVARRRLSVFENIANESISTEAYVQKIRALVRERQALKDAVETATLCLVCQENPRTAGLVHGDGVCAVACGTCATAMKQAGHACPQCIRPFCGWINILELFTIN